MQDRRQALASIGMASLALGLPTTAAAAPAGSTKAPRLRPGDTVGLVTPASFLAEDFDLQLAVEAIEAMGLKPKLARRLNARFGYLAGQDRERAADFNAMFADKDVRAVFAARGGWGAARILPYLDWKVIRANPKLLIGFSDITALHLAFAARAGFPTVHGPNAGSAWTKLSVGSFRELVFEGTTPLYRNPPGDDDRLVQRENRIQTIRPGKASGRLLGGNLTVLSALIGTPYMPSFEGAILFLEDVDEAEYRIDRMLTQLALAGVLRKVAGVVFGQCTNCRDTGPSYGGFTLSQVLRQHLEPLGVPAYQGALFGHVDDQFSLPVGARAEIDATEGTIRLLESPVA
jgi:muramoyltetrapeptide carboxypeptidase